MNIQPIIFKRYGKTYELPVNLLPVGYGDARKTSSYISTIMQYMDKKPEIIEGMGKLMTLQGEKDSSVFLALRDLYFLKTNNIEIKQINPNSTEIF